MRLIHQETHTTHPRPAKKASPHTHTNSRQTPLNTLILRASPTGYLNPLPILYLGSGGNKKTTPTGYPTAYLNLLAQQIFPLTTYISWANRFGYLFFPCASLSPSLRDSFLAHVRLSAAVVLAPLRLLGAGGPPPVRWSSRGVPLRPPRPQILLLRLAPEHQWRCPSSVSRFSVPVAPARPDPPTPPRQAAPRSASPLDATSTQPGVPFPDWSSSASGSSNHDTFRRELLPAGRSLPRLALLGELVLSRREPDSRPRW
jgi:hypothetical protein